MREIYLFIYFHTHTGVCARVQRGCVCLPETLVTGDTGDTRALVTLHASEIGKKTGPKRREIVIRRTYKFGRQLTVGEVELLKELITWRPRLERDYGSGWRRRRLHRASRRP